MSDQYDKKAAEILGDEGLSLAIWNCFHSWGDPTAACNELAKDHDCIHHLASLLRENAQGEPGSLRVRVNKTDDQTEWETYDDVEGVYLDSLGGLMTIRRPNGGDIITTGEEYGEYEITPTPQTLDVEGAARNILNKAELCEHIGFCHNKNSPSTLTAVHRYEAREGILDILRRHVKPAPDLDKVREALEGIIALYRGRDEGWTESYERIAELFFNDVGKMAPGKSAPEECGEGFTATQEEYADWVHGRVDKAREALRELERE